MGTDKGLLDYHGKPQREHLFGLAKKYCSEVYFSCRAEQRFSENTIIDLRNLSRAIYFLSVGTHLKQTFKVVKE
jgi:molybdopterin-guanine dinucleotide biosynthesis protein A